MDNRQASQVTTGVIVIAVGLLLLAGQLDAGWHFGRLWPVILLIVGVGRFAADGDGRRTGVWLIFLGVLFLLNNYRVFTLHDSWPLFIVAAGVGILMGRRSRS